MMLAASFLFAVAMAPKTLSLPPSVHPEFAKAAKAVAGATQAGDFDKAGRLVTWLPSEVITVEWDDQKVPAKYRREYRRGFEDALKEWSSVPNGPRFAEEKGGLVRFTFEKELAESDVPGIPLGAATFFKDKANPRLEVVLGLSRGPSRSRTEGIEIRNEVVAGLAQAMGFSPNPLFGFAASRTDLNANRPIGIFPGDIRHYQANRQLVAELTAAVEAKQVINIPDGKYSLDRDSVDAGTVTEGEKATFTFQLSNPGDGPLLYRTGADCGCVIPPKPGEVAPGSSTILVAQIDTRGFPGDLQKKVVLYTNDPEQPTRSLNLRVRSRPEFRWIMPAGNTVSIEDGWPEGGIYFFGPDTAKLDWKDLKVEGIVATASAEPWSGDLADAEMSEPVQPRKGWKIKLDVKPEAVLGRTLVTLSVPNPEPTKARISLPFFIQRGILASPSEVFFGEMSVGRSAFFTLSRPKAFTVTEVKSDSPSFKVEVVKSSPTEVTYKVIYQGGQLGDIRAKVILKTDDPKQPTIVVPIAGIAA